MNNTFKKVGKNLITWQWVESLFNWTLKSGGTLASILFLAAGIWLSVLNAVKGFIAAIMPTTTATMITYLAKTSFTALPEIILFLSALNTLDQIRMIRETDKGTLQRKMAWTWAWLFGLPTAGFIGYALFNIAGSLLSADYTMPDAVIVLRGLTCFVYALLVFIYNERGRECFASMVADLKANTAIMEAEYTSKIAALNDQIEFLKDRFVQEKNALVEQYSSEVSELSNKLLTQTYAVNKLSERASSLASQGLENYSNEVNSWLESGLSTLTLERIVEATGHSKRKVLAAKLKTSTRNKQLYLVSSVLEWLRKTPPPMTITEEVESVSNVIDLEAYREEA